MNLSEGEPIKEAAASPPTVSLSDISNDIATCLGNGELFNYFSHYLHLYLHFSLYWSVSSSESSLLFFLSSRREIGRNHDSPDADRRHGSPRRMRWSASSHHLQLININRVTMSTIFNFLLFSIDVRALTVDKGKPLTSRGKSIYEIRQFFL